MLSHYSIKRKTVNKHYIKCFIISIWYDLPELKYQFMIYKKISLRPKY